MANRDKVEIWLDKHNHLMELIRTGVGLIQVGLSLIILKTVLNG